MSRSCEALGLASGIGGGDQRTDLPPSEIAISEKVVVGSVIALLTTIGLRRENRKAACDDQPVEAPKDCARGHRRQQERGGNDHWKESVYLPLLVILFLQRARKTKSSAVVKTTHGAFAPPP